MSREATGQVMRGNSLGRGVLGAGRPYRPRPTLLGLLLVCWLLGLAARLGPRLAVNWAYLWALGKIQMG